MRPAFATTKQAAAFALLLLLVLLSPALAGKKFLPPREQAYAAQGWGNGPYPYIQQQIFHEKGDIDIVFIGSSHILHCLDARLLQKALSQKLGRPATIRVLGWGGAGYGALYFVTRDLLEHRHVRMLVFYDDHNVDFRHLKSHVWFRFADDYSLLAGLPLTEKAYYYFSSLVEMPHNLLCLFRPSLQADLDATNYWEMHYRSTNLAANLGSTTSELGFDARPKADADSSVPFVPYSPTNGVGPAAACIYSAMTETNFAFASNPLPIWEIRFMHLFADLAATNGCQLVLLHIPVLGEVRSPRIEERSFWPEIFGTNLVMLGIPPARMFAGLSDANIRELYFNPTHLNKNGQAYYTSLILPDLLNIYETSSGH